MLCLIGVHNLHLCIIIRRDMAVIQETFGKGFYWLPPKPLCESTCRRKKTFEHRWMLILSPGVCSVPGTVLWCALSEITASTWNNPPFTFTHSDIHQCEVDPMPQTHVTAKNRTMMLQSKMSQTSDFYHFITLCKEESILLQDIWTIFSIFIELCE